MEWLGVGQFRCDDLPFALPRERSADLALDLPCDLPLDRSADLSFDLPCDLPLDVLRRNLPPVDDDLPT